MCCSRPVVSVPRYARSSLCSPSRCFSTSPSVQSLRPSIAPKPSIDIKHIRQNPELYSQNCLDRNYKSQAEHPLKIVKLFNEWRTLQQEGRSLREKNNSLRTTLSHSKTFSGRENTDQSIPEDKESVLEEARGLKQQIGQIEAQEDAINAEIEDLALELPNLTSAETPIGNSPKILGYINNHPDPPSTASDRLWRNHVHIANELDLIDFSAAGVTSGWGWYYLKNEAALLEQALVQYALQTATQNGFTVVSPPSIVYSHISSACGFRPRDQGGEQQVYTIQQSPGDHAKGKPELSLAGTAEIPFAGMNANTDLDASALPHPIVGPSRCYRAEAGGRGVETKGLYRVHEFTKVEMFAWTQPGAATPLFERMLAIQTHILRSLGLHCRILEQPTADLGASAVRKQDIETFFPSRRDRDGGWGEVTSASICTDYQTRRLATRVRAGDGRMGFPHTVNGTAVAVPRVLAALLENGWDERTRAVRVPEVLWPWMHGVREIERKRRG
ncbi:Serine--tRNA ligase, mitochondrial [Lambiella insularis]|nr:Serine--tRNA ligase, mitochondrial [Lambiella insularis]